MFSRRGSVGFVSLWVLAYLTRDLPATWPDVLGPREHDVFARRPRTELDDRDLVVELAGLAGWCEVLAMRLDNAEWCASRRTGEERAA